MVTTVIALGVLIVIVASAAICLDRAMFRLAADVARQAEPADMVRLKADMTLEPTRVIAPSPASWPDEHQWVNVEVECPVCGDFTMPVTTAWLLWHARESLTCPVCHLPTGQNISYEASA